MHHFTPPGADLTSKNGFVMSQPCGDAGPVAPAAPEAQLSGHERDRLNLWRLSQGLPLLPPSAQDIAERPARLEALARSMRHDTGESFGGLVGIARSYGASIGDDQ